jgi:geranylgeranyl pyrophosphate synthase
MTFATQKVAQEKHRQSAVTQFPWLESVQGDLEKVTQRIREVSFLDDTLLDATINMIIESGGKRMRPTITLLAGRAVQAPTEHVLSVAASVELLHTATLIHDDLIDGADQRRGTPTLHSKVPLGITVLTGDFMFAQAAALAAEANNVEVVQVFANTLVDICKGELLQAKTRWQVPDIDTYNQRIYGKTAALFRAAAFSGALLGPDVSRPQMKAFETFGREVGMAFQIIDDALDFLSDSKKLGKPAGHDLHNGIITLPALIFIEEQGISPDVFIDQIRDEDQREEIIKQIQQTDAARRAFETARDYIYRAEDALTNTSLSASPAIDHLLRVAYYSIDRDF